MEKKKMRSKLLAMLMSLAMVFTMMPMLGHAAYAEDTFYTIKFVNYDGTGLQTSPCKHGQVPVYTGDTPEKPRDENYTYRFDGWTPELAPAYSNATYTATYAALPDQQTYHSVIYKVVDGTWEDGTQEDKRELVLDRECPKLIPSGMKPYEGYEGGAWSPDPNGATITGGATFTYTFTRKQEQPVRIPVPAGRTLTYNGKVQTGVAGGAGYVLDGTTAAAKAGTYTAKASLKTGYAWADGTTAAKSIEWKIGRAGLTITADDKSGKAGEALKPLTYKVSGAYVKGDDLGIRLSTAADKNRSGTYEIRIAWNNDPNYDAKLIKGKYTVTAASAPTPLARAAAKKRSMTLGWSRVDGAEGYDIFFARCDHKKKKGVCRNVKTIKGNRTFKWTKSGLKKGVPYKFYVRAYVTKNGKKTYISKSPTMHAYTGNGTKKYTNAKSVKVNRTNVTLAQGKTFRIKAKVNKVNKKKKLMPKGHAPTLRYMTSNSKVAAVSSGGRITARGKGTCVIVAFAHNGVSKQIKVTVR